MQWKVDMSVDIPMINNRNRELFSSLNGLCAVIKKKVCRFTKVVAFLCGS